MEPIQYLKVIRDRWLLVVMVVLIGLGAAWLTRETAPATPKSEPKVYEASAILLSSQSSGRSTGLTSLSTLEALVRLDKVVTRAAERIEYEGNPKSLLQRVQVTPDQKTGFLRLSASGPFPAETKRIVDGYSKTLIDFVTEQQREELEERTAEANKELEEVTAEVDSLNAQLEAASGEDERRLNSLLGQKLREKGALETELQNLRSSVAEAGEVTLIQPAVVELRAPVGPTIPQGSLVRFLAGGLGGLLLGLLLALGLERIDARIRNSEAAERHFEVPLIARIPRIPRKQRRSAPVAVAGASSSASADAFRVLAASILRWSPLTTDLNVASTQSAATRDAIEGGDTKGARLLKIDNGSSRPQHAILITSAASGEGKTTVVANLAGAFAEMGKVTMVLSCDLRNPEVHELLGVANDSGLVDALESTSTTVLKDRVVQSALHETNIKVVPSGAPPPNPAELLNSDQMRRAIDEACRQADVVLIDTPPILAAMDVAMMVSEVDAVLVIARSGKTSVKMADSTSEMLNRLGAPFLGVVLNCSTDMVKPKGYYRGVLTAARRSRSSGRSEPSQHSERSA